MINSWLSIQPIFPIWVISLFGAIFFSWLFWKEYQRRISFFIWRTLAVSLIALSIFGLVLRPTWHVVRESDEFMLLTTNYEPSTVDSLLKKNPSLKVMHTANSKSYGDSETLSFSSNTNKIYLVTGDGLPYYELNQIKNKFHYLKGKTPYGIIEWIAPPLYKPNQQNKIQGKFHAMGESKIIVLNPEGAEDSVSFPSSGIYSFQFFVTPKQAGRFLYQLKVIDSEQTIEKFPVEVAEEKKLKIGITVKYPSAEIRYLKNFLIEKGHSVVMRFQVSKANFRYEYGNQGAQQFNKLTSDGLKSFDLMIADNELLESLHPVEQKQLEESVRQGLGLLVLYNGMESNNKSHSLALPLTSFKSDTARIVLGTSTLSFLSLPAQVKNENITTLFETKERAIAGYIYKGAGKVAFQLLQETYRLQLEGKNIEYGLLWSPLIESIARIQDVQFKINLEEPFPIYTDEPLTVTIIASQIMPLLYSDNVLLPLRKDVVIDDYWHGTTWAGKAGWHSFSVDSISTNYYVPKNTEWRSLRIAQQQKLNELAAFNSITESEKTEAVTNHKLISPLLFFILFILGAGFLWLTPKL